SRRDIFETLVDEMLMCDQITITPVQGLSLVMNCLSLMMFPTAAKVLEKLRKKFPNSVHVVLKQFILFVEQKQNVMAESVLDDRYVFFEVGTKIVLQYFNKAEYANELDEEIRQQIAQGVWRVAAIYFRDKNYGGVIQILQKADTIIRSLDQIKFKRAIALAHCE
ncbi:hypothetical protein RFI_01374, partial [Reticulomyxa filosa]